MEQTDKNNIIPEQKTGAKTDIESSHELSSLEEARAYFQKCKKRLLNINEWGALAGVASASFRLTDSKGNELERSEAQVGNYFKIDVPGPGTVTGDGFDWVRIESIEDNTSENNEVESVAIRVRPTGNPGNDRQDVAHFFTEEATSSFIVERRGNIVFAGVHGRNEKPNTKAEAAVDKTRNTMVALGAMAGFSNVQWKKLVNGILGQ